MLAAWRKALLAVGCSDDWLRWPVYVRNGSGSTSGFSDMARHDRKRLWVRYYGTTQCASPNLVEVWSRCAVQRRTLLSSRQSPGLDTPQQSCIELRTSGRRLCFFLCI
jgi:hypothetical protein